jgi:hypothetical protein
MIDPPPWRFIGARHRAHAEVDAALVDPVQQVVRLRVGVLELQWTRDRRVVDEHVDAAERRQRRRHDLLPALRRGDVLLDEQGRRTDLVSRGLALLGQHVGQHHLGAMRGKQRCLRRALPASRARDDRHGPLHIAHRHIPSIAVLVNS